MKISANLGTFSVQRCFWPKCPKACHRFYFHPKIRYGGNKNQNKNSPVDSRRGNSTDYNAAKLLDFAVGFYDIYEGVYAVIESSLQAVLEFWIFILGDVKRSSFFRAISSKRSRILKINGDLKRYDVSYNGLARR